MVLGMNQTESSIRLENSLLELSDIMKESAINIDIFSERLSDLELPFHEKHTHNTNKSYIYTPKRKKFKRK